jgi:arginyl-tRNA synthetase
LHVAKSIWQIQKKNVDYKTLFANDPSKAAEWIGQCYSEGSNTYDTDESVKAEIDALNKIIYEKTDAEVNAIYDWGRAVTLEAFEIIYAKLGTTFDQYFFESDMATVGAQVVRDNTPRVFEESDGAIVFKAEKYDPKLHTRVFISSKGLPMYEAKEIGLTMTKFEKYNPDLSIVTTAIEQGEYMKVVRKAIEQINPSFAERMTHITHGMMRLSTGKMSSRKGNVVTGESLIADSIESVGEIMAAREHKEDVTAMDIEKIGIGALKYSILKQEIGGDIIYNPETSISFDGDAGPYLQYMVVRIASIKRKAESVGVTLSEKRNDGEVLALERELLYFGDIVHRAANDLRPHHIAQYAISLSRAFSSFYESTKVADPENPESGYRLALVEATGKVLTKCLELLGIKIPERM